MSEQRRFPRYLDAPMMVLWFESDTFSLGMASITLGTFVQWSLAPIGIFLTWRFAKAKKHMNRGYFKQIWYFLGFQKIKGYPDYFERRFFE